MAKNRLAELRRARGISIAQLAETINTSVSQIHRLERGERQLTQRWMEQIGRALGVSPDALIQGTNSDDPMKHELQRPNARGSLFRPGSGLPVLGEPAPGLGEYLFEAQAMDHVARPRTLEQNARAYAAYVHDDTMAPRYHVGECLYVAPGLPARPGTYVMVHRLNGRAQLRRLTAISADTVVLTTHNPQHDETVARAEITSIDPIVLAGQAAPA